MLFSIAKDIDIYDIIIEFILLVAVVIILISFFRLFLLNRHEKKWIISLVGVSIYAVSLTYDLISEFFENPIHNLLSDSLSALGLPIFAYGIVKIIGELILLVNIDPFTKLYNKRFFLKMVDKEIETSRKQNYKFSIIFLDLNGFKQINDNLGHKFGDTLLYEVAKKIKVETRETDIVTRYGGDEFIILLPNRDELSAFELLKRIQSSVSNVSLTKKLPVSISGGISTFPNDGSTISELSFVADKRMYRDKEQLRNQHQKE